MGSFISISLTPVKSKVQKRCEGQTEQWGVSSSWDPETGFAGRVNIRDPDAGHQALLPRGIIYLLRGSANRQLRPTNICNEMEHPATEGRGQGDGIGNHLIREVARTVLADSSVG